MIANTAKLLLGLGALGTLFLTGCVMTGTHEAAIAAEKEIQPQHQGQLDDTKTNLGEMTQDRDGWTKKKKDCDAKATDLDSRLTAAMTQNTTLVDKVSSMGQNVEQLLGEKDTLDAERQKLNAELQELRRMQAAAEIRAAEYKKLIGKLAKMIDAGSLEVKIRNGLMLVTMSSDVLFSPGRAKLKPEAVEAIQELAATIAQFEGRKFQVVGHSDASPIRTARFPSNWELSSQRAIEVVKVMTEAGVPSDMLSAAGQAEFDPIAPNETDEEMAMNRRVELIFVPKIDELPGFDQILGKK